MHSKMFNEGKPIEGKTQWWISRTFWTGQTFFQLSTFYFWPGMQTDVKNFLKDAGFSVCKRKETKY
jgi:hypothetical protein